MQVQPEGIPYRQRNKSYLLLKKRERGVSPLLLPWTVPTVPLNHLVVYLILLYRFSAFLPLLINFLRPPALVSSCGWCRQSLAIAVAEIERARAPKDHDEGLVRANEVALRNRLQALKSSSETKRGAAFGRVVEDPRKEIARKQLEQRRKRELEEEEERRKREELKAKEASPELTPAVKPDVRQSPVRGEEKKDVPSAVNVLPEFKLKKADKKDEKVHPMVGQPKSRALMNIILHSAAFPSVGTSGEERITAPSPVWLTAPVA